MMIFGPGVPVFSSIIEGLAGFVQFSLLLVLRLQALVQILEDGYRRVQTDLAIDGGEAVHLVPAQ